MNGIYLIYYVLTLKILLISPFMVEGASMEPNYHSNDVFLINENIKNADEIKRGDVVVFALPEDPDFYYVKRVVGLPGEKIKFTREGVFIDNGNGFKQLKEPYLLPGTSSVEVGAAYRLNYSHEYSIPQNEFFVMGDNRQQSLDSRYFSNPFVSIDAIKGKYIINLSQL